MELNATLLTALCLLFFSLVLGYRRAASGRPKLDDIPAIGPSGTLTSFIGAMNYLRDGRSMMHAGYQKYRDGIFRVPLHNRWLVVVSGAQRIHEISSAKESHLSLLEAVAEIIQAKHTVGTGLHEDSFHIDVVRSPMTRSLSVRFPDIFDEIHVSLRDIMGTEVEHDWVKRPAFMTIMRIITRSNNRLFLGIPLCRDEDYTALSLEFTGYVMEAAIKINLFPSFLKPLAGRLLSKIPANLERAKKHLGPLIEERMKREDEYGRDWPGKPNDLITWLLEGAKPDQRNVDNLVIRVLTVNFAAIPTTTMSFTQALFYLAANPDYVRVLREEVEPIVKEEGWTKDSISKMFKVDSFLKETQRLHGPGATSMERKVLKEFTFSDGLTLPVGSFIAAAAYEMHHDERFYSNPDEFQPFRFSDLREREGENVKYQLIATGSEYLTFGHGRHGCPGRFMAALQMKAMIGLIITTYDIKLETERAVPKGLWIGSSRLPNQSAQVLFRKRRA